MDIINAERTSVPIIIREAPDVESELIEEVACDEQTIINEN